MPISLMKAEVFLATTAIDEFWDKSKKLVFLGDWCKLYNRKQLWENLDAGTVPFYWDSTEKTQKGILYCQGVLDRFYRQITKVLNEYQGMDKDDRFYKLSLGTWPFHFIHQLYDKYLHLKDAINKYPGIETWRLHEEQNYIPLDYEDYCNVSLLHGDDRYQLQLYSDLIKEMGMTESAKKLKAPLIQKRILRAKKKSYLHYILDFFYKISFGTNPVCLSGMSVDAQSYIQLWKKFLGRIYVDNFEIESDINLSIDRTYRTEINVGLKMDEFEIILSSMIMKHIPIALLEGMSEISKQVMSKHRKHPGSLLTMQLGNNIARNIFLANKFDSIRIYAMQHGGGYGIDQLNQHELYERDVCDIFFAAGWGNDRKTISLSNIKFKISDLSNKKTEDILLCLNDLPRYVYRLHFVPMGSTYNMDYLSDAISFAKQLKNRNQLILRLYPDPIVYGNCTDDRIKDALSGVRFDDGKRSFISALSSSRLFVSNYFNTTILEALANNIPSIVFINRKFIAFSDESWPYIEKLYAVGILQPMPDNAANFVDKIYDDVASWWNSRSVQEARISFVERYAYCGKNWVSEWRDVFSILAREPIWK